MRQPDDPEVKAWLEKAREDLIAAQVLAEHAAHLESVVGFHCQQAVEKALKAMMVALDMLPPRIHDLDVLLAQLVGHLPVLEDLRETASYLNGFSVMPRYPTLQPASQDGRTTVHKARTLAVEAFDLVWATLSRPSGRVGT